MIEAPARRSRSSFHLRPLRPAWVLSRPFSLCLSLAVFLLLLIPETCLAETYEFVSKWGSYGTGDGQFDRPTEIDIGPDGSFYVADTYNHRVQKFAADRSFVTKWGGFSYPSGIAVDGTYVYVSDFSGGRVQKFTTSGVFVTEWGGFDTPVGIDIAPSGNVFVTEYGCRVKEFTPEGALVRQWGSLGTGDGQFMYSSGLSVSPLGYVYVCEFVSDPQGGIDRVQKFTLDGAFVSKWGSTGTGDGQFDRPRRLEVDETGDVYVADLYNHRVQKFDKNGNFITKWGTRGSGDGQFVYPHGMAFDAAGHVYVTDYDNNRVQEFAPSSPPPDTAPPVTSLTTAPSAPDGTDGWFKTLPAITLVPNESADTYYQWDSNSAGGWQVYLGPLLAPEGEHTLHYYSVDAADNTETTKGEPFKVANTREGPDVEVSPGSGVVVSFSQVTSAGQTSATATSGQPAGPPSGFRFRGYLYDVQTTATFTGPITITFPYDESEVPGNEQNLKLFHWTGSSWEDCTISVDTAANTITGRVNSLSPFGVGYPYGGAGGGGSGSGGGGGAPNYVPASSDWSMALMALLGLGLLWGKTRRRV